MSNSATRKPTEYQKRPKGISSSIKPAPPDEFDKLLSKNVPHIHEVGNGLDESFISELFTLNLSLHQMTDSLKSNDSPLYSHSANSEWILLQYGSF